MNKLVLILACSLGALTACQHSDSSRSSSASPAHGTPGIMGESNRSRGSVSDYPREQSSDIDVDMSVRDHTGTDRSNTGGLGTGNYSGEDQQNSETFPDALNRDFELPDDSDIDRSLQVPDESKGLPETEIELESDLLDEPR
jgi:hypothetical protein